MSYDLINAGIKNLMGTIGLAASKYPSVKNMPSEEYGNAFVLNAEAGESSDSKSETLSSLVYDVQTWKIFVPFQRSNENQDAETDQISRMALEMIRVLDNPSNWESYARIQKYKNWKIEDKKGYFLLTMELEIEDTIVY